MSAAELNRAVDLLVRQVGHWEAPRWAAPAADGRACRADLVHGLVQRIADLSADAEGGPRRPVPRLDNDIALPDQLRVVVTDLVTADPPAGVLAALATEVRDIRLLL